MNPNQTQLSPVLAQILRSSPDSLDLTGGLSDQTQQQGQGNGLLDFLVPAAGGVLGGIAGGALGPVGAVGGAAAGQAGGQALLDILAGKAPGADVVGQGVGGLAGGALGEIGGAALGKILGNTGDALATKGLGLTKLMMNKLAQENGEPVAQTLLTHNLAGVDAVGLQKGIQPLQTAFDAIAGHTEVPVDHSILQQNASDALGLLKNSSVPSKQKLADQVDQAMSGIMDKVNTGDISTLGDLNSARKEFDSATADSQFGSADWGVNRYTGSILRKTVQDTADQAGLGGPNGESLSLLGQRLNKLYNILDVAKNREGMGGGSLLSLPNLFKGEMLGQAAGALSGNPLIATGIGAASLGASKAIANPVIAGLLSRGATGVAGAVGQAAPLARVGGALFGGGVLGNILSGGNASGGGPLQENEGNNEQQSPSNNADNVHTTQTVTQPGSNSQVSPSGVQIDDQGHYVLPDLNSMQTTIPGQIYPPEAEAADLQKVSQLPFYMQDAAINQIRAKSDLNKQVVSQYVATHALAPAQVQMMQQLPAANDQLNTLRDLIKSESGKNLFQAMVNDNPVIQTIKSATDPQYAQMLSLMKTVRATAEYAQVHGRLSNFDVQNLNNTPGPGDTVKSALAKLDLQQGILADTYARYLPAFGYSLMAGNSQSTQGGAPSATPASPTPTGGGIPTALFNILGLTPAPTSQ